MYRLLISCFLLALSLSGQASSASSELAARLNNVDNLSARFEQEIFDDEGKLLEQSSGTMAFQRPHQLRWEVEDPYRYLIVTNGETLWRFDPDFDQLSTESFTSVSQTPLMILAASAGELEQQYEVSRSTASKEATYVLVPRAKNPEFRRLELQFVKDQFTGMVLQDNLGQKTTIALQGVTTNQEALADSLFTFTAEQERER